MGDGTFDGWQTRVALMVGTRAGRLGGSCPINGAINPLWADPIRADLCSGGTERNGLPGLLGVCKRPRCSREFRFN